MTQELELSISRYVDAPPSVVWKVYTERMEEFFCPKPWRVEVVENDFRSGGRSALIMRGPDGEEFPTEGVFLEVVPERKIVSTDAYAVGWVPQTPFMTAITSFEPEGSGTRYTAVARHWTEEAYKQHQEMGFEGGWGTVADQLAELAEAEVAKA